MILNCYEYSSFDVNNLPAEWQSQSSLSGLIQFLQSNWEQRSIFYNDNEISGRQQFLEISNFKRLITKNYIGTIAYKGHQLNIFPRVFKGDKYDTDCSNQSLDFLMKNLVKWIEYSTKFDYPYINISANVKNSNDLQELFISLYVRYVKSALDRGLFYRYEDKVEDLNTIRGKFDIKDYYINKYANGVFNKFKCEYSTFEFDNLLNRVIKYTLKMVSKLSKTNITNQKIIRNLLLKLNDVSDIKCVPSDCDKIKLSKMQENYRVILNMSKIFLMNCSTDYNIDSQDTFCFLFPTEVLFEGFIGGYLQHILQGEAIVKTQVKQVLANKGYYGSEEFDVNLVIRPDIMVHHNSNGLYILDTKYKETSRLIEMKKNPRLINEEIRSGDTYQVLMYAMKNGRSNVYLLYPQFNGEDPDLQSLIIPVPMPNSDGSEYIINVHLVRLPFVFEDDERVSENLKKVLKNIFN